MGVSSWLQDAVVVVTAVWENWYARSQGICLMNFENGYTQLDGWDWIWSKMGPGRHYVKRFNQIFSTVPIITHLP